MFSKEECKIISEFYAHKANYVILSSRGDGPQINKRRNALIQKLTNSLNASRPSGPVTTKQVKQKIQDIKKGAKKKSSHNKKVQRSTGSGPDESVQLTPAEEIMVAKLGNTPAFNGITNGGLESGRRQEESEYEDSSRQSSLGSSSPQQSSQDDNVFHFSGQSTAAIPKTSAAQITTALPRIQCLSPATMASPILNPSSLPMVSVPRENLPNSKRSAVQTNFKEQQEMMQLQKEVLLSQKQLINEQLKATKEFREFINEYRMKIRGGNLEGGIPFLSGAGASSSNWEDY